MSSDRCTLQTQKRADLWDLIVAAGTLKLCSQYSKASTYLSVCMTCTIQGFGAMTTLIGSPGLPEWMPNEEGMVILDWMVYNDHACHIYTAAKSRWPSTYKHLVSMRNMIMGDDVERDYVLPYDANPTLFFELNCQSMMID